MTILAYESATAAASVAVLDGERLLGERALHAPMRHLEWLMSATDGLLGDLGLDPAAIEGVAVSTGPGSFTGLRVGIATAAGWARARRIPAAGVPTLEALAAQVPGDGVIVPLLDAKRGEVAGAAFRWDRDAPRRLLDDVVAPPEIVLGEVAALGGDLVVVLGDGLDAHGDAVRRLLGPRARFAPPALHAPRAAAVGLLGGRRLARGDADALYDLQPRYGRRPAVRLPDPR